MNGQEKEFYELFGLTFEELGSTRMLGRVLAYFMIADPPEKTMSEIVEELGVAKSSVSVVLKQLGDLGMVDKFRKPGMRADHYKIAPSANHLFYEVALNKFRRLTRMVEEGKELLRDYPPERLRVLDSFGEIYRFILEEWPKLSDKWGETHKE